MNLSSKDLKALGYSQQPDGSFSHDANTKPTQNMVKTTTPHPSRLPHAIAQPDDKKALDSHPEAKAGRGRRAVARANDSTPSMSAEIKSKPVAGQYAAIDPAYRVIITRFAPRLLDADNLAGGCKGLIDAVRRAHLIPDDDPRSIAIEFRQQQCSRIDQRTEIEIWTVDPEIEFIPTRTI